jgi:hypothetical protein
LKTADFLLCRYCGVYLGAVMRSERGSFGIINVRVLHSLLDLFQEPERMNYDNEYWLIAKRAVKIAGRQSLSANSCSGP